MNNGAGQGPAMFVHARTVERSQPDGGEADGAASSRARTIAARMMRAGVRRAIGFSGR